MIRPLLHRPLLLTVIAILLTHTTRVLNRFLAVSTTKHTEKTTHESHTPDLPERIVPGIQTTISRHPPVMTILDMSNKSVNRKRLTTMSTDDDPDHQNRSLYSRLRFLPSIPQTEQ
jgi:hypothetical protein